MDYPYIRAWAWLGNPVGGASDYYIERTLQAARQSGASQDITRWNALEGRWATLDDCANETRAALETLAEALVAGQSRDLLVALSAQLQKEQP